MPRMLQLQDAPFQKKVTMSNVVVIIHFGLCIMCHDHMWQAFLLEKMTYNLYFGSYYGVLMAYGGLHDVRRFHFNSVNLVYP